MSSKISHDIKSRKKAKDVFITPIALAKKHIEMTKKYSKNNSLWLDPFRNSGVYYNNFDTDEKDWCEILDGRDFFKYDTSHNDITICSNPPYSMIDDVLKMSIMLEPKVISYLLLIHHLTTRRLESMEKKGYTIQNIYLTKVYKWYGMSAIVTWVKTNEPSIINYDRKVWREGK